MRSRRGVAIALAGCVGVPAGAQPRVEGPVTLVVPYTPATGPDLLARLLSPVLQQRLGAPCLVENRAGASGNIGTQMVARAAPDGRTLLVQVNTFVMNPSLFRQVPYDPVASFAPISLLTTGDLVLVVASDIPATTPRALAELTRSRPGGLDYASPGIGTPQHLAMELFRLTAGVPFNHVPYRGAAPAIQDLIGRRVAAMVLPVHTALPLVQGGQVRALATGGERRAEAMPELPTLAEAGYPGFQVDLWYGLFGPAGLPVAMVAGLNAALQDWLAEPATRATLRAQGMAPAGGPPERLAELVRRDLDRWAGVIRQAGITAD